ncbi:hypothetical protein Lsai_1335 [Legionella sainthelensi]|uniref:GNAT family N-acetyltransferase n=1 Tax=Legionella sainthelensi TaxID=28087 RepID=A0A0W0YPB6_9GAMM|nr:GNAT family N-acetyltransferase [Legionella sainthelensi]KTD58728.1 hypothetical protein Lsai_1335 [Legionella sainthelensi]VEH34733.1 Predicted acetyltransferase involved in intracellular survival and related acetyltransferases [Legionella sainthelensi]
MIVQRIQTDPKTLSQCTALMNICFPKAKIFNIQYMRWLYIDNPEGSVIGFNVWDRDQLVAHYACIPAQIQINSTPVKAMLSLNTATHPNYQGKGLFTKLANMTYETAYKEGFTAVFGVSNENSSYGFQKLGFQFLRPLEARLGLGSLHINHDVIQKNVQFQRI